MISESPELFVRRTRVWKLPAGGVEELSGGVESDEFRESKGDVVPMGKVLSVAVRVRVAPEIGMAPRRELTLIRKVPVEELLVIFSGIKSLCNTFF